MINLYSPEVIFQGSLRKFRLISNNLCFGPCPAPEDEIEQRLTINDKGRVWLSRYCYGKDNIRPALIDRTTFSISLEDAAFIMKALTDYFNSDYELYDATDVGLWDLILTNTEGVEYIASGSLCDDLFVVYGGISEIIRTRLNRHDLFVFDGNPPE